MYKSIVILLLLSIFSSIAKDPGLAGLLLAAALYLCWIAKPRRRDGPYQYSSGRSTFRDHRDTRHDNDYMFDYDRSSDYGNED